MIAMDMRSTRYVPKMEYMFSHAPTSLTKNPFRSCRPTFLLVLNGSSLHPNCSLDFQRRLFTMYVFLFILFTLNRQQLLQGQVEQLARDAQELERRMKQSDVDVSIICQPDAPHDWFCVAGQDKRKDYAFRPIVDWIVS